MTDKQLNNILRRFMRYSHYTEGYRDGFKEGVKAEKRDQWMNPLEDLPENKRGRYTGYSIEVLGLFKDGSFSKCNCSIEENIWFIGNIVCDMPLLWTYLPKK